MNRELIFIAHNLRSSHNVGSLLRTADAMGIDELWLTGYTPYPSQPDDKRMPHVAGKVHRQIQKTALGAEDSVPWHQSEDLLPVLDHLRTKGYKIIALEQTPSSVPLPTFEPPVKTAVIVGREVEGIEPEVLALADMSVEIPMMGRKESLNVIQAAAMAMYHIRFYK